MEGAVVDRQLSQDIAKRFRFAIAREQDDAGIRRLLRQNPMDGDISLSFEREPNYFSSVSRLGAEDQTILAFEGDNIVCMGRCSVRERYINGRPRRVGYLSELRLDRRLRGRSDIIRRGYQFFEEVGQTADFYFTSIASDNARSIRLLERGLPGLPIYTFLGEFVTLVIPVSRSIASAHRISSRVSSEFLGQGLRHAPASSDHFADLARFLNDIAAEHQLAATWSKRDLDGLLKSGIELSDLHMVLNGTSIIGCATVWDQRQFRQTVIRGYSRILQLVRPWLNAKARVFGESRLPDPGSVLAHAFLSPLAAPADQPNVLLNLIRLSSAHAAIKGIEYLALGFEARDVRLDAVCRAFRCRKYSCRLYQVHWAGGQNQLEPFDGRILYPEIAFL